MTSDLDMRLLRHNEGVACNYTAKRRPVQLVHSEMFPSAEAARDRERQLKRWTANKKEARLKPDTTQEGPPR